MKNLILRNTPEIADCFILRDIESDNGKNRYEVFCENDKIVICGDCKISQAMGYYAYLKKYCSVNFTHAGQREIKVTSAPVFEGKLEKTIKQQKRAFMSYGTLGYSCAFWTWEKWEKEIDIMAMNGINMPLSVIGSEAVWYYTMRDFTYSETGALEYLSGPGFWFKQLTGNISGYFSPKDVKYIESRVELGKKIISREVELGMTPIQQGFSGVVPRSISKLFKKVRMSMTDSWCKFPVTFQLDPADPLFKKFGTALLAKQQQLFGSYHYYAVDPFYQNVPGVRSRNYLWNIGRAIDTLLKEYDEKSVWVMQSTSLRTQVAQSVPVGRLLILDIEGNVYKQAENFWGHNFILGSAMNHGNRTMLQGDLKELAENKYSEIKLENCVGTGIFAEGIDQNPIYLDLALEMLTEDKPVQLDYWLSDYAKRRYGSDENSFVNALNLLEKSCYSENGDGKEQGSIICARPCTSLKHTAVNDTHNFYYRNNDLISAVSYLLSANEMNEAVKFDACSVLRQALSNYCNILYKKAMEGFNERDVKLFESSVNEFMTVCEDMNRLLQTIPECTLSWHLKQAGALAFNDKDKQNFELNLLAQITLWGPISETVNYDYAWKEWGGMISSYYSKRWQSFFERLAYQFTKRTNFSTQTRKQINERNEYKGNQFGKDYAEFEKKWLSTVNPSDPSDEDTIKVADELMEKYRPVLEKM